MPSGLRRALGLDLHPGRHEPLLQHLELDDAQGAFDTEDGSSRRFTS